MKETKSIVLACMVAVGIVAVSANAGVCTFRPNPANLENLAHGKYYAWKIDFSLPTGETIDSARLFFDEIRNNNNSPNVLYVSLLNGNDILPNISANVFEGTDRHHVTQDNTLGFSGAVSLEEYRNLPGGYHDRQNIMYNFDSSEIDTLNSYVLADGDFGIGFDPDCNFYNEGVTLTVETAHAPVPGAFLLGSIGLSCSGWLLRKRRIL